MKGRNNGNAIATELIRTICYFISHRIDDILDSVYVRWYTRVFYHFHLCMFWHHECSCCFVLLTFMRPSNNPLKDPLLVTIRRENNRLWPLFTVKQGFNICSLSSPRLFRASVNIINTPTNCFFL